MIARTWKSSVRRADAEEYAGYIRETGFAEYGQTPGNRGAWMLRRDEGERTEFITLSLWESRTRSARSPARTSRPRCSTRRTSAI
jgi:heme-degrading monooxygenase HmoA